ncbi:hypothetical protein PtrSN001A_009972 [Pyrenophora tritici-repentis]|nr:hypothetical protein PtrSN001A_009972 [Pyrenophora tritici-repentis]
MILKFRVLSQARKLFSYKTISASFRMSPASSTLECKPSSSPFRFMDLPAEIRNQVYSHCTTPTTLIHHVGSEEQDLDRVKETPEKQYQFFGLALTSRQLRREFYPVYMSDSKITVKLYDLHSFLDTFHRNADASTRGTLIVGLDEDIAPVDIFPLLRLSKKAFGFSCKFCSEYYTTELPDNVKRNINFNRPDKLNILAELHATAEHSRQRSVESRWKYARKNGEVVIVRDVLGKIIRWVDTFKQVGDAAVQYDPGHASLPWAGIRFLLQVAVNDIAKYGSVVEDLARVAELICRFALIKQLYLQGTSKEAKALELAVVKLYARTLVFLSTAKQYLEQGTAKRIAKSAFLTGSDLGLGLNEIQVAEKDVDRCMALVDKMDNTENYAKLIGILARIDMPLRRMDDGLNNIHDDLQASKRTRIVQWLSPEPYIQHHKQNMQGVLTGTGQWLLADPIFKRWKDDSASSILWLHGIPGSGKSKLVSVVIEEAVARYKAGDSPQPVFFYCSRNPADTDVNEQAERAQPIGLLSQLSGGQQLARLARIG